MFFFAPALIFSGSTPALTGLLVTLVLWIVMGIKSELLLRKGVHGSLRRPQGSELRRGLGFLLWEAIVRVIR